MVVSTSSHTIPLSVELDEFVAAAARDALGRFADQVISVDVFLNDVNGPKGGVDKQAVFRIHLRQRREIITQSARDNLRAAIRGGAKRARRAVGRHLRKARRIEKVRINDRLYELAPGLEG